MDISPEVTDQISLGWIAVGLAAAAELAWL